MVIDAHAHVTARTVYTFIKLQFSPSWRSRPRRSSRDG